MEDFKERFNITQKNNKVIDIEYNFDDSIISILLFNNDNIEPDNEYTAEILKSRLKNSIIELVNGENYDWNYKTFCGGFIHERLVYIFINKYNKPTFITGEMEDIPHIIEEINSNSKIYLVKLIDEEG